ncbi:MAG: hypothetical protein JRE43_09910, partial [Deltaproteobacteria bacterium]|nr:hypothetical protein [Deltaproteobacteria bacterium]
MSFARRLFAIGFLSFGIGVATLAQAGNQLFEGSWSVKAFGNECSLAASGSAPGPHCGGGAPESAIYSAIGLPQGVQCNPFFPRCPFTSTPTDGYGAFAPLGGVQLATKYCAPWVNWQGNGTTARPAKGATATNASGRITPPLYRNPVFFSAAGEPNITHCSAASTNGTGGKGLVQAGNPLTGTWIADTTGAPNGGFFFSAAPPSGWMGIHTTKRAGEPPLSSSYSNYRYTYATLRNSWGFFGPALGPGSFNILHNKGANPIASINVKQGAAKFGGTMRMLGALTSKACKYSNGGCSMGTANWRYEA